MMASELRPMLDAMMRKHVEYEELWWTRPSKQSRRGRWVVLEPGPGRLLKGSPRHLRDLVDASVEIRGRRFSSLSRARRFARRVGGKVKRWRRKMQGRGPWRYETNPWKTSTACLYVLLPAIYGEDA